MNDEHGTSGGGELTDFNIFATASEGYHAGGDVVAKSHEFVLRFKDVGGCLLKVFHLKQLDLSNHDGVVVVG